MATHMYMILLYYFPFLVQAGLMDQNCGKSPERNEAVLCLVGNAVLREDLIEALTSEGFRAETGAKPERSYCSVVMDIDDATPPHVTVVRKLAESGVPVILIGHDVNAVRDSGLPCNAFFSLAFLTDLLVRRLRDLLEAPVRT